MRKAIIKLKKEIVKRKKEFTVPNIVLIAVIFIFAFAGILVTQRIFKLAKTSTKLINPDDNKLYSAKVTATGNKIYDEVVAQVLPAKGMQSKIHLGDSIIKLVNNGVIDKEKFEAIYKERGGLPDGLKSVLSQSANKPILLTKENANIYVNLLWPLGLANYMSTNINSPINADNGKDLNNFASTGGWNIGKEENGGAYFNKFKIVELTPEQEALVTKIAQNTYRPCCDNSTFFQDCNHGSALLGLLQLGVKQGLTENQLYKEALAFNSFWFPNNYIQTALYFKIKKNTDWDKVNPRIVLGYNYSAISQWGKNVAAEVAKIPNLIPKQTGGGSCST